MFCPCIQTDCPLTTFIQNNFFHLDLFNLNFRLIHDNTQCISIGLPILHNSQKQSKITEIGNNLLCINSLFFFCHIPSLLQEVRQKILHTSCPIHDKNMCNATETAKCAICTVKSKKINRFFYVYRLSKYRLSVNSFFLLHNHFILVQKNCSVLSGTEKKNSLQCLFSLKIRHFYV